MHKLSFGWAAILLLLAFSFSACDDDEPTNNPVLGTAFDVASTDGRFSVLAAAAERTGLDVFLDNSSANITVFAPTDDAFAASGINLDDLSDEALADVLRYHVIAGQNIVSSAIPNGRTVIATANTNGPGAAALPVTIDNNGGAITVNANANVIAADVQVVNGTVHGIDQVLLPPSLLDRARIDGRFTTLAAALERTGLDEVIAGPGTFTVFAPTDDAFATAGINLDDLSNEDLTNTLLYHVLGATVPSGALAAGDNFVKTLGTFGPEGTALTLLVNNNGGNVTLNADATVVVADVLGTNGVIHAVDKVLAPQTIVDFATKAAGTSELAGAVVAAGLVDALSGDDPLTVFAPINPAFEAISDTLATLSAERVAGVLTAHVVSGNITSDELSATSVGTLNDNYQIQLRVNPGSNTSSITDDFFEIVTSESGAADFILTDIQGTNGVIHLIDEVLLPENF